MPVLNKPNQKARYVLSLIDGKCKSKLFGNQTEQSRDVLNG